MTADQNGSLASSLLSSALSKMAEDNDLSFLARRPIKNEKTSKLQSGLIVLTLTKLGF